MQKLYTQDLHSAHKLLLYLVLLCRALYLFVVQAKLQVLSPAHHHLVLLVHLCEYNVCQWKYMNISRRIVGDDHSR